VNIRMDPQYALGYKSASQIARKITEAWASTNLFCAACNSSSLATEPANTEAVDFSCPSCHAVYQLKAVKYWNERRIPDAGYDAMMRALQGDSVPNLLIMQYTPEWIVQNLLLIPSFFFSPAAIQKRNPLGPTARRAGWVGCNILLSEIANDGKIDIVSQRIPLSQKEIRERYNIVRPLSQVAVNKRGWTLDVLCVVRKIGKPEFSLAEVYNFEDKLANTYPKNRNIRPKIRQQLQELRNMGYLSFEGKGQYRLLK
jgi:type II restriction enzyme